MTKKVVQKVVYYQCEICSDQFQTRTGAEHCERKHKTDALVELLTSLVNLQVAASSIVDLFGKYKHLDEWVNTDKITPFPRDEWILRINSLIVLLQTTISKDSERTDASK